jgi:hypothetical protein
MKFRCVSFRGRERERAEMHAYVGDGAAFLSR